MQYEVVEVQSQTQIDRQKAGMSLQGLKHHRQMLEGVQSPQDDEESGKSSPRQSQVDKRDITTVRCLMGCSLSRMGRRSQELLTFSCIFYLLAILASASAKSNTWQNVMHMGGGMV